MSKPCRFNIIAYLRLLQRYVPPKVYIMILAGVTGLITGTACVVLKVLVKRVSNFVLTHLSHTANWYLLVLPLTGLVLTALFCRYVLHMHIFGTAGLKEFLGKGLYKMNRKLTFGPIIANTITLGFGGSAGAEGPIAVSGAAIGSTIARKIGFTPEQIRLFIAFGAGAGIAAIFKAPVGGMLFALEVIGLEFTTFTVLALLLACLASAMTCYMLTGFTFDVFLRSAEPFATSNYAAVAVFGIITGIYSIYYSYTSGLAKKLLGRIRPVWGRIAFAGTALGILLFCFPALYGEGYGVMDRMLNGDVPALYDGTPLAFGEGAVRIAIIVGGILLVKGLAVGFTTGAGVAGDFAPTLFVGSLAGLLFAVGANTLLGLSLPVGDFALIGMCATFAGIIKAPFMAMFLTPEMTGNFTLFLPMVLTSALSYGVVRLLSKGPVKS